MFGLVPSVLIVASLLGCLGQALRAARVGPQTALGAEERPADGTRFNKVPELRR